MSYRLETLTGAAWTLLQMFYERLAQVAIFLIAAGVLGPREFGVATLAIAPSLVGIMLTPAASDAVVQETDRSTSYLSTGLWVMLAGSVVMAAIIWLIAPAMAAAANAPEVVAMARVSALAPVAAAIGSISDGLLSARFAFRTLAIRKVLGITIAGVLCIGMALLGWGAWAIVVQTISFAIVATLTSMLGARWFPSLQFSRRDARQFINIAGALVVHLCLEAIANRGPEVIGGLIGGPSAAGILKLAKSMLDAIVSVLIHPILFVLLPLFARMRAENRPIDRAFVELVAISALLYSLPVIWISGGAGLFVHLALGERWFSIIPIMAAYGFLLPAMAVTAPLRPYFVAIGRLRVLIAAQVVLLAVLLPVLVLAARFGAVDVAISYTVIGWGFAAGFVALAARQGMLAVLPIRRLAMAIAAGLVVALIPFLIAYVATGVTTLSVAVGVAIVLSILQLVIVFVAARPIIERVVATTALPGIVQRLLGRLSIVRP